MDQAISTSTRSPDIRPLLLVCLPLLLAVVVIHVYFISHDHGIYWPDEIYQSLEPAHALVYGRGMLPWEYIYGARPLPLVLATSFLLKAAKLLGIDDPLVYVPFVKTGFLLLHLAGLKFIYHLLTHMGVGRVLSALGAATWGLSGLSLYFSTRLLGANLALFLFLAGLNLSLVYRRGLWGGLAIGLALGTRPQMALLLPGFFALREFRSQLKAGLLGVALSFLMLGLVDFFFFGQPFHTVKNYIEFNLVQAGSGQYGSSGFFYYLLGLWRSFRWPFLAFCLLSALYPKNLYPLALTFVVYMLGHSIVGHKELRFLLPLLPFVGMGIALGAFHLRVRESIKALLLVMLIALNFRLDYRMSDLQHGYFSGDLKARWVNHDLNTLLARAGKRKDICGLAMPGMNIIWSGAYSYFHADVPLYGGDAPPPEKRYFSHAIFASGRYRGLPRVTRQGAYDLVKFPWDTCKKDPTYQMRADAAIERQLPLPPKPWPFGLFE